MVDEKDKRQITITVVAGSISALWAVGISEVVKEYFSGVSYPLFIILSTLVAFFFFRRSITAVTTASASGLHIHLPEVGSQFVGRKDELQILNNAWENEHHRILIFHAPGGTGKTALIRYWLDSHSSLPETTHRYMHSFYSQGTDEKRPTSAESFLQTLAHEIGLPLEEKLSPHEKGVQIAKKIADLKCLLFLDGIEPLQHPPNTPEAIRGRIKDPGLLSLLKTLSERNPGLCIITTRVIPTDLSNKPEPAITIRELENLNAEDGVKLLEQLGAKGRPQELRNVSEKYQGHALTLNLLGTYIANHFEGDIRKHTNISLLGLSFRESDHAEKMMGAYKIWLSGRRKWLARLLGSRATQPDPAMLEILYMVGLFDRPLSFEVFHILCHMPIKGLNKRLSKMDQESIQKILEQMQGLRLLLDTQNEIDAHPLVREYFGRVLEKEHFASWQEAHRQLYGVFKDSAKELPDTLEEMEPLFRAVWHGCRGGLEQEALVEVYWKRIMRENEFYLASKLGALGSQLACLSSFFTTPFAVPSSRVSEHWQAGLLNWAAFALRALGRLREAVEPMEAGMKIQANNKDWKNAASAASNLSELLLVLGDLRGAVTRAEESVGYAEKIDDWQMNIVSLTTHADTLFHRGWSAEAREAFVRAETIQKEVQPGYHYLYSAQGFQYCTLLLEEGEAEEALRRAEQTLKWAEENQAQLLTFALDTLTLGRSHAALGHREAAEKALEEAVAGLRKAGEEQYLPLGLLARAAFHLDAQTNLTKSYQAAKADFDEVYDIAHREMRLHMADYWLVMTRLAQKSESIAGHPAKACWKKAQTLIEDMNYGRRYEELEDLARQVGVGDYHAPEIPAYTGLVSGDGDLYSEG